MRVDPARNCKFDREALSELLSGEWRGWGEFDEGFFSFPALRTWKVVTTKPVAYFSVRYGDVFEVHYAASVLKKRKEEVYREMARTVYGFVPRGVKFRVSLSVEEDPFFPALLRAREDAGVEGNYEAEESWEVSGASLFPERWHFVDRGGGRVLEERVPVPVEEFPLFDEELRGKRKRFSSSRLVEAGLTFKEGVLLAKGERCLFALHGGPHWKYPVYLELTSDEGGTWVKVFGFDGFDEDYREYGVEVLAEVLSSLRSGSEGKGGLF